MAQYSTMTITVKGKEEIERLVLVLNIGFMSAIEEGAMSAEESQFRFYSPYTVDELKKRKVDEVIIDLHLSALELDDIKSLVSDEHYLNAVKGIKKKSQDLLRMLPVQNGSEYRHWVQQSRRHNDIYIKTDREERQVMIGKNRIGGCVVTSCCPDCGQRLIYYDQYDEDFCPKCNQWARPVCGDENCPFCNVRPEKPLEQD